MFTSCNSSPNLARSHLVAHDEIVSVGVVDFGIGRAFFLVDGKITGVRVLRGDVVKAASIIVVGSREVFDGVVVLSILGNLVDEEERQNFYAATKS